YPIWVMTKCDIEVKDEITVSVDERKPMPTVRLRKVSSPANEERLITDHDTSEREARIEFSDRKYKFFVTGAYLKDCFLVDFSTRLIPKTQLCLRELQRVLWNKKWWWLTPPIIIAIAIVLNIIVRW